VEAEKDRQERDIAKKMTSRDSFRRREPASELRAAYVEVERICKIWKKGLPARCTYATARAESVRVGSILRGAADSEKK